MRALLRRLRAGIYRLAGRLGSWLLPESQGPADSSQRQVLNQAVTEWIEASGPAGLTAAEISGTTHAERGWLAYEALIYPEFDLCAPLPAGHATWDVVLCEQVLEHVIDPAEAARNLFRLCRPGGTALVSTPFLVKVHELPEWGMFDYWRFTPRGMRVLLERAGFEVDGVHSWGNRETIAVNLDRWSARRSWLPTRNEPDLPVQVWAFARRPDDRPLSEILTHDDPAQLWYQLGEIIDRETYLQHGIRVGEGDRVLDVGANVGVAAAFFARCGAAEVHCFEPIPDLQRMLSRNTEAFPACHIHPFGLSDEDEQVEFTYYRGAAAMSSRYADPVRDETTVRSVLTGLGLSEEEAGERVEGDFEPSLVSCQLRRTSAAIDELGLERIDLLKIDVERAELDVLEGIDERHWPLIRQVVIEAHDEKGAHSKIRAMLERHGFKVTLDQGRGVGTSSARIFYGSRE